MDEDQDVLLSGTDDESSENENLCLPVNKSEENNRHKLVCVNHTKAEFLTIKVLLILSTTLIIILLPLYMETSNVVGDVYSLMFTNTLLSTIVLTLVSIFLKLFISRYKHVQMQKLPIKLSRLGLLSFMYFLCAFMIMYALDRKRVVCHLQDPMKGLVLVWSFFFYFIFSQQFMCLQHIFSVTAIITGLFVSVDFSLCNEFKCRGYERQHISDDTGEWAWKIHAIWTAVYIGGMGLCAAYFSMLEHTLLNTKEMLQETSPVSFSDAFPRSLSTSSTCALTEEPTEETHLYKKISAVHLAMWLHIAGVLVVIGLFWTDFIPQLGKGSSGSTFLNYTMNGIRCHFVMNEGGCNNLPLFSWLFLGAYVTFVVTSTQFLLLTQSAVYTIATMATAIPIAEIWWSFFFVTPTQQSSILVWNPSFSGELISSILGLPIIVIGLYFLYKSHLQYMIKSPSHIP